MEKIEQILNEERNVKLIGYLQPVSEEFGNANVRPAVLVLPGGGYQTCSAREAEPVAQVYMQAGYQVFILYYSLGADSAWPNPLEDYEQAAKLIRAHAEEWRLIPDRLAVIGFSAGAHLAACAAAAAKNRPDAVLLGYPVITKETVNAYNPGAPGADELVTPQTCPAFLFAGRDDQLVPVTDTMAMANALMRNNVSCECHIYAKGGHGFSTCDRSMQDQSALCSRTADWVKDSVEWLGDVFGSLTSAGMTEPALRRNVTGDTDDVMSIDCTFGHLMQSEAARAVLTPMMQQGAGAPGSQTAENGEENGMLSGQGSSPEEMFGMIRNMTVRYALAAANVPEEALNALDAELRKIPN